MRNKVLKFKKVFLFIVPGLIMMLSCQENTQPNILSEELFINVLIDLHITDAAGKQQLIANNRNTLIKHQQLKGVLEYHNVRKSLFDSTVTYYLKNGSEFAKIYKKVEAEITKKAERINSDLKKP